MSRALLTLLLSFISFAAFAQSGNITGNIIDENNEPIVGASVAVQGTTLGTISDLDGNFTISAKPKDNLVISFLGFVSQTIAVGNQTNLNIVLIEDSQELEEVVVVWAMEW